jgi:hypothetical protein
LPVPVGAFVATAGVAVTVVTGTGAIVAVGIVVSFGRETVAVLLGSIWTVAGGVVCSVGFKVVVGAARIVVGGCRVDVGVVETGMVVAAVTGTYTTTVFGGGSEVGTLDGIVVLLELALACENELLAITPAENMTPKTVNAAKSLKIFEAR